MRTSSEEAVAPWDEEILGCCALEEDEEPLDADSDEEDVVTGPPSDSGMSSELSGVESELVTSSGLLTSSPPHAERPNNAAPETTSAGTEM